MKNILITFIAFIGLANCCNEVSASENAPYELVGFYEYGKGREKINQITNDTPIETHIQVDMSSGPRKSIAIVPKNNGSLISFTALIERKLYPKIDMEVPTGFSQESQLNILSQRQITEEDIFKSEVSTYIVAKKETKDRIDLLFAFISIYDFQIQRNNELLEKMRTENIPLREKSTKSKIEIDKPRERSTTIVITPKTLLKTACFVALSAAIIWNFDQVKTYFSQFMSNLWQAILHKKANS